MVVTTRVRLDRIASATRNAGLSPEVIVGDRIVSAEGYVLAVRILEDKSTYNTVEDVTGRMLSLRAGDVLAGVLGTRRALRGYAGVVPPHLAVGDTLEVLNLGGILGRCTSVNPEIGPPFRAEVLGAVLAFPELGDRVGRPAHIRDGAVPPADLLESLVPVVYVAGTCMNAGKTVAATELVRGLARGGLRVAAAKLTGVSLMRDALSMLDAGAVAALTFNDVGIASTHAGVTVSTAKGIFNRLAASRPDVIVAELGDGILGEYGVQDILRDAELMAVGAAHVMAAPDPVACWGAVELMRREFGLPITAITGPATDNEVGQVYITRQPGAAGAQRPPRRLRADRRRAGLARPLVRERPRASRPRPRERRGGRGRRIRRRRAVASSVPTPRGERDRRHQPESGGRRSPRHIPRSRRLTDARFSSAEPGETARGRDVVFLASSTGSPRGSRARCSRLAPGWSSTWRRTSECGAGRSTSATTGRTRARPAVPASATGWRTSLGEAAARRHARSPRRAASPPRRSSRSIRWPRVARGRGSVAVRRHRLQRRRGAAQAHDAPSRRGPTTCSPTRCWGTGTRPRSCESWREWTGRPDATARLMTHSGPFVRGIYLTLHARLAEGMERSTGPRPQPGIAMRTPAVLSSGCSTHPPELTHAVGTNYALHPCGDERPTGARSR